LADQTGTQCRFTQIDGSAALCMTPGQWRYDVNRSAWDVTDATAARNAIHQCLKQLRSDSELGSLLVCELANPVH
jgi:hypothetical protein